MTNPNILIIRLSSIGDILLSTPFIRQVRHTFYNSRIDYVIKEKYKDLLIDNPHIDNLIIFEESKNKNTLKKIKERIKRTKYNYIFDLHNNFRSIYLRRGLKADYVKHIKKDKLKQTVLVFLKQNRYKKIVTIPERYLNVAKPVGVKSDNHGLELYWQNQTENSVNKILQEKKLNVTDRFICIAPGAGFFTKRWPIHFFKQLTELFTRKTKYKILILGGPLDRQWGNELENHPNTINLTGELSLLQSGIVISKSSGMISNDSGLMHMATAVKTPVLAIFGSSVRELGFFPYRSKNKVLEVKDLYCRPCSHIGKDKCPEKHFRCMLEITPQMVFDEFNILTKMSNN